jgi:hypothetical protein
MQKINIGNIYKYLQPGKIKRIYKILALFEKSGGFKKSWRFYENQADLINRPGLLDAACPPRTIASAPTAARLPTLPASVLTNSR